MKTTIKYAVLFLILGSFGNNVLAQKVSQPTIIVLPSPKDGKSSLDMYNENTTVRSINGAIEQVLAENKMEVKDLKAAMSSFDKLRMKHSYLSSESNAILAANSGADIYLEYAFNVISEGAGSKVRLDLTIFEVCTSKKLGAANGVSKAAVTQDMQGLAITAVNGCIKSLLKQVERYWENVGKDGKPVYIVVTSNSVDLNKPINGQSSITDAVFDVIQQNAIVLTEFLSTPTLYILNPVYIDIKKFNSLRPLKTLIEKIFYDMGIEYTTNMEGRMIEIELK
ncbi:MAG: DUF6175 family protein [Ignavibacteria bacterium]